MLTYDMEKRGSLPLYEYLYRKIRGDILDGRLLPREKLPSKRSLAKHLGVSVITVQSAYALLTDEGYTTSVQKSGYFVSDLGRRPVASPPSPEPNAERGVDWELDLRSGSLSPDQFPFSSWSRLMRKTMAEVDKKLLSPSPAQGISELRTAISDYLRSYRGLSVSPDRIIIGAGAEYLYLLLFHMLGDRCVYAVEDPGYSKVPRILESFPNQCRFLPLDDMGLRSDCLRNSDANVVHITPGHHFPTGIVMPAGRRLEILRWASEAEGRFIIEDEYDSEFRFSGRPIPALQSIDSAGRVIYLNTFTKSVAPSVRISYMILPAGLNEQFLAVMSNYSCPVSVFEQHTLAKFISEGHFARHLNRMRDFYNRRRELLLRVIQEEDSRNIFSVTGEEGGLHFLLHIKTELSDAQLKEILRKLKVRCAFLSDYCHFSRPRGHALIVSYAGLDPDRFAEKLSLLLHEIA